MYLNSKNLALLLVLLLFSCKNNADVKQSDVTKIESDTPSQNEIPVLGLTDILSTNEYNLLQSEIDSVFDSTLHEDFDNRPKLTYSSISKVLDEYIEKLFYLKVDTAMLSDSYCHEYMLDTFKIREVNDFCQLKNYSTLRMVECENYRQGAEEALIEKYYNKLLSKLEDEDKTILIENQRLWRDSFQSDKKLSNLLTSDKYTGGGTMWSHISYENGMTRVQLLFDCYWQR